MEDNHWAYLVTTEPEWQRRKFMLLCCRRI